MAKGKVYETIISLSGNVDPSVQKGINEVQKRINGLNVKALAVGATVGALAVTAVKVLKDSAAAAIEFETSFAKVSTQLDKNVVDLDNYRQAILNASKETGTAVDEIAEGVYSSISAGIDSSQAVQFTQDVVKLAKGGFTDTEKAVDVVTTAINGYKMSVSDTTKISDMLITTQNLGKTTVDELASSMGAVIPVASAANFEIDDLSAAYATLTKNGIATNEAGTYMKSMLSELTKSGSITDKELRRLTGSGFADLKEAGYSTTTILSVLASSAENQGKTLKDMFGSVEAGSAALTIMSQDGAEFDEMLKSMQDSAGQTEKAFETMASTPQARMDKIKNKFSILQIQLGEKLLPVVENVLTIIEQNMPQIETVVTKVIEGVGTAITNAGNAISFLSEHSDILLPVLKGIVTAFIAFSTVKMVTGIYGAVTAFTALKAVQLKGKAETLYLMALYAKDAVSRGLSTAATIAQTAATGAWNITAGIATTVTTALGTAINFLTGPIGLVILAITGLIAAGVWLYNNWDLVKEKAAQLGQFLSGVWDGIKTAAGNLINGIKETFYNGFSALAGIVKAPINAVIGIINGAIGGINSVGFDVPDWVPLVGGKSFHIDIPQLPLLAKGGFTNGVSIAGEQGTEAVISFDPSVRAENLSYWAKAGQMLGADRADYSLTTDGGSGQTTVEIGEINFSPKIEITGNADKNDVMAAIEAEYPEFTDMLDRYFEERGYFAYGY